MDEIKNIPTLCRKDIKTITGKQLQAWVNSEGRGGIKRVSKLCGYSIRSFERMYNYDGISIAEDTPENAQVIPTCIKRFVYMSLELEEKGAEITKLKYENKILKKRLNK